MPGKPSCQKKRGTDKSRRKSPFANKNRQEWSFDSVAKTSPTSQQVWWAFFLYHAAAKEILYLWHTFKWRVLELTFLDWVDTLPIKSSSIWHDQRKGFKLLQPLTASHIRAYHVRNEVEFRLILEPNPAQTISIGGTFQEILQSINDALTLFVCQPQPCTVKFYPH